jgi:cyclohexadienyl dehydratase
MSEPRASRRRRAGAPARRRVRAGAAALLALLAGAALAEPRGATLRVGTSGDYPPFSRATGDDPPAYEGFDVELARRYAAERGLELEWVRFRWSNLLRDLADGRFEVAMSGITVRPERSAAGRFSVPVVETGAVALIRDASRFSSPEALDRERLRIAVNAGGHLEAVAREKFPRATLVAVPDNAGVLRALAEGAVDAAVSDTAEASVWQREHHELVVAAGAAARAAYLDDWLLAREADGSLEALRREHLGPAASARSAEPLPALVAALDERLALMPWIGVAKRRAGLPLVAPAREEQVLDDAAQSLLAAAHARDVVPPPVLLVRRFFVAQLEAAKQVQWDAVRDERYEAPDPLPDLDAALRPAISRIDARSARLLLALPQGLDRERIARLFADGLRSPWLARSSRHRLEDALAELVGKPGPEAALPGHEAR